MRRRKKYSKEFLVPGRQSGGRGIEVDDFDPASRTQREDGYNSETGLSGGDIGGLARHVAVAPRDDSTDLRYLDFKV